MDYLVSHMEAIKSMNAIILAAGLGSRFGEMTKETSKTLLPVGNLPGIEHTLRFLKRNNITDIIIVTGYRADRFSYLKEKYGVELLYNDKYREYNNRYSFALAADHFGDTLVIDGDVVILGDILVPMSCSTYYLIQREEDGAEWIPELDMSGRVRAMLVSDDHKPSLLGVSYWTKEAGDLIRAELPMYTTESELRNTKAYWDDIPVKLYDKLEVRTVEVSADKAREMDNREQYEAICRLTEKF